MDNREIEQSILNIRLPEIIKSIVEVFGDEHREVVLDRLKDVTFFGRVSNLESISKGIDVALFNATNVYFDCEQSQDSENKMEQAQKRIEELKNVKDVLQKNQDKINSLNEENKLFCSLRLQECLDLFPNNPELQEDIFYFCMNYNGGISDFYINEFSRLLNVDKSELLHNEDYISILNCAKKIKEMQDYFFAQTSKYNPIYLTALQKIKDKYLYSYLTNDEIDAAFLNRSNANASYGTAYQLTGIDGTMKKLIGITINSETTDRNIIHEIIHIVTSFVKDGNYCSGFRCRAADFLDENLNITEVFVDWLAIKVLKVYLRDNCPMFSPDIYFYSTIYSHCFGKCQSFLEKYEKDVINALMTDNPLSFREQIGPEVFDKMDSVMGKLMKRTDLSHEESDFLDSFSTLSLT